MGMQLEFFADQSPTVSLQAPKEKPAGANDTVCVFYECVVDGALQQGMRGGFTTFYHGVLRPFLPSTRRRLANFAIL
jgi:hypothetical protein